MVAGAEAITPASKKQKYEQNDDDVHDVNGVIVAADLFAVVNQNRRGHFAPPWGVHPIVKPVATRLASIP